MDYDVPVEEFGLKMLESMGWKSGEGIGKSRQMVKAMEYVPRPSLMGLGAQTEQNARTGEYAPHKVMGRIHHCKPIQDKLNVPRPLGIGSLVQIINGEHKDLFGSIVQMNPYVVALKASAVRVKVLDSDFKLVTEEDYNQFFNSDLIKVERTWAYRGIVVRVQSKSFLNGKYYGVFGRIEDVLQNNMCLVSFEATMENIPQSFLETVVPKTGQVMILNGDGRGNLGLILETYKEHKQCLIESEDGIQMYKFNEFSQI